MMPHACTRWCAIAVVLLAAVPLVLASVADPALLITASNANGTSQLSVPFSNFTYDDYYHEWDYSHPSPVTLANGAKVSGLNLFIVDDSSYGVSIVMQYTFLAGTSLTNFTVDVGMVSFAPIPAALAAASMGDTFTLTELNYDQDNFAQLTALDNYAYKTYYGQAGSPNEFFFHGSESAHQFGGYGEGLIYNVDDNWPNVSGTFASLGVAVDRIHTTTAFSLTLLDKVEVQQTFKLKVPEPAGVALLTAGGLLLMRRRR